MTPDRHARVKEIFLAACGLPPERRAVYVRGATDEAEVAAEVERLLRHHVEPAGDPMAESEDSTATGTAGAAPEPTRAAVEPAGGARAASEAAGRRLTPGQIIAERFRIVAPLGRGGMGEVYRAEDLRLGQTVALKFLPADMVRDPLCQQRLQREVRVARGVTHVHVCRVFDLEIADGEPFLAMEYVDGEDLKTLLKRIGRLPTDAAVRIARQLCLGLAAAHARGVLHRDLKPANVMIDGGGQVRITDFGLAGLQDEFSGAEIRSGTPAYMAPEQQAGREVTPRSDIYSLGLLLYELFTGRSAFVGDSFAALARLKSSSRPAPPSQYAADVPPAVERVILRCLEPDPDRRPESALHVLAGLPGGDLLEAAVAAGQTPSPSLLAAAGGHEPLRRGWAAALLVGTLVLIGGVALLSPRVHPLASPAITKPPLALADRAREIAAARGGSAAPVDEAWGFAPRIQVVDVDDGPPAGEPGAALESATNGPLFWYRQAGAYLTTADPLTAVFGNGRVGLRDPPHRAADDVRVVLDGRGQLLAVDGPGVPVELVQAVPAATSRGVAEPPDVRDYLDRARLLRGVLFAVLFFISVPLAAYNLRRGRSDPLGAAYFAVFVFALRAATWLLAAHHTSDLRLAFSAFFAALAGWVTLAAATWLYYVALEPFVRQYWPHTLVAWSRVLRGQAADPLVGAHLLIGAGLGAACAVLVHLELLTPEWLGGQSVVVRVDDVLVAAGGTRLALAYVLHNLTDAIHIATLLLLLVVLFRALLGSLAAALACSALVFAATAFPFGSQDVWAWLLIGALIGLIAWLLTRFGLVCVIATTFVCLVLTRMPLTTDLRAWYADLGLLAGGTCAALAAVGCWNALRPARVA